MLQLPDVGHRVQVNACGSRAARSSRLLLALSTTAAHLAGDWENAGLLQVIGSWIKDFSITNSAPLQQAFLARGGARGA